MTQTIEKALQTNQNIKASVRLADRQDAQLLAKWMFDPDYLLYFGYLEKAPYEKQIDQILKLIAANQFVTAQRQTLIIENRESQTPIGFAQVADIDWKNRNCALEIYIDPKHRAEQYSVQGSTLVFEYAFGQLNMHKVYSYVYSHNEAILTLQKSLKHDPEVVFEKHLQIDAKTYDIYVFAFYRNYYEALNYPKDLKQTSLAVFFKPENYLRYLAILLSRLGYLDPNQIHTKPEKNKQLIQAIHDFQKKEHLTANDDFDEPTLIALLEKILDLK